MKGPSGRTERGEGSVEGGGGGGQAAQVGGAPLVIPIDWLINLGVRGRRGSGEPPKGTQTRPAVEVEGWGREKEKNKESDVGIQPSDGAAGLLRKTRPERKKTAP